MGPDEHVSRQEFSINKDFLQAQINKQTLVIELLVEILSRTKVIPPEEMDRLNTLTASSQESQSAEDVGNLLTFFEEMHGAVERYEKDSPSPEND